MNINNPRRYEDISYEIGSIKSPQNVNKLLDVQRIDPNRARFLGNLVKYNVLKLGGKRQRSSNKNNKNHKSLRRHHSKKNRKSMKRK
jgi:hypothetical protein